MASYHSRMKRKGLELDHVNDDAFDFTLSSPACKIRRLDADLPPIIEQEKPDILLRFEQQHSAEVFGSDGGGSRLRGVVIEELTPVAENQERAIVLYKPMNTPLYHSPSHFVVDSDLISSIKDQSVWGINSDASSSVTTDKESKPDEQLAVIPWVPPKQLHQALSPEVSEMEPSEPMDAEEMEAAMEAEDNNIASVVQPTNERDQLNWNAETVPLQWQQQQHCMIPQPPQNPNTPIVWYR